MKLSVISPVKNEAQFIGYSVMAVIPYVHEIIYAVAPSDDGTVEILEWISKNHDPEKKLRFFVDKEWDFDVHNLLAYNHAFNYCIGRSTGDGVWFLHPDMVCTNPNQIKTMEKDALAWYTHLTSYARDLSTIIAKGRASKWKNIAAKKFGLHYYGAYGSQNEDFYFSDITGKSYQHHGEDFKLYPYDVEDSGLRINHYCEVKPYKRRYEKMKACLKTLSPNLNDEELSDIAGSHPRVTLESKAGGMFGFYDFQPSPFGVPSVFEEYGDKIKKITECAL